MALDAMDIGAGSASDALKDEARALARRADDLSAVEIVRLAHGHFGEGLALVSSFGADSAVLLHMVATVDPNIPVLLVDTGKLFPATLAYRDTLVDRLGLRNVRSIHPDPARLSAVDPAGALFLSDTDACCGVRKVEPLARALDGVSAWITGRKRHQAATRAGLKLFEADGPRIKVNPLAAWTSADVEAWRLAHDLPAHPLVAEGYRSIGCLPCTSPVAAGEDERAGRWRGQGKTECGIHLGLSGSSSSTIGRS